MNIIGYTLVKFFFALQCLAGFFLMLFGAGMIENPDNTVALIGGMTCTMGVLVFVMFGVLLARRED